MTRMALHRGAVAGLDDLPEGLIRRADSLLAAAHPGQILLSHTVREALGDSLPPGVLLRDLGAHRLKDLSRAEPICQLVVEGMPADFPPPNSLDVLPNNLSVQLTRFVGREAEVAEIGLSLIRSPLLTLIGSGGCGKTRLALHAAADLLLQFPEGVWHVDLAGLAEPQLVPQAVASVLSVREEAGASLTETLCRELNPCRLLLLLDNTEHLRAGCAGLVEVLLECCPGLRILATGREPLGIPGEAVWPVPSLTLPEIPDLPPTERQLVPGGSGVGAGQQDRLRVALQRSSAAQLFVDRATAVAPAFAVTDDNAPAVARICRRLDGIPLAIELAAARVRLLAPEQIAARLDDRFRLLTGGSRTTLRRHQTLQAAMEWSYDLLAPAEQLLWQRLSVFAGGFTLEAAEAVCSGVQVFRCSAVQEGTAAAVRGAEAASDLNTRTPEDLNTESVLDLLEQLVDKSIVVVEERGTESRYRLLETIREYGWQRLQTSGNAAVVLGRHRDWYLELAEQGAPALRGPDQGEWLERLETEHDNLRAALDRTVAVSDGSGRRDVEAGLRLGAALWRFWAMRGHLTEGRSRLFALLALPEASERTAARAGALKGAGALAYHQGDYDAARSLYEQSLSIYHDLDHRAGITELLNNLGMIAFNQGDAQKAQELYDESLRLTLETGDRWGAALSLMNVGLLADERGDYAAARAHYVESLALGRAMEDRWVIAAALSNLGLVAYNQGEYQAARTYSEESRMLFEELGDRQGVAATLGNLGNVARQERDYGTARRLYEESLAIQRGLGDESGVADSTNNLGTVARCQGNVGEAWDRFATSLALYAKQQNRPRLTLNLSQLARLALDQGQPVHAARLLGVSSVLLEEQGVQLEPLASADTADTEAAARAALAHEAFEAAWTEGRGMALEEAVALASRRWSPDS
jgi:predicted ATPase